MTYLHHITINTGHCNRSHSRDVPADVIAVLRPPLLTALAGKPADVPAPAPIKLEAAAHGRALVATISAVEAMRPIVTIGVALHSRAAARLWDELARQYQGEMPARPPAPWLAALIWPSAPPLWLPWIADLERCLAWTWIKTMQAND